MSNFNDLMDASVDAGLAWARRHTRQPEQPDVIAWSQYVEMYNTCKEIAAQRDLYRDSVRPFYGKVLVKDELNAYFRKLAKERGIDVK